MKNTLLLFLLIFAIHGRSNIQESTKTETKEHIENKKTTNKKVFIRKSNHKNERYPELRLNQKIHLLLLDEKATPQKYSGKSV